MEVTMSTSDEKEIKQKLLEIENEVQKSVKFLELPFEGFVDKYFSNSVTISTSDKSEYVFVKFGGVLQQGTTIAMTRKQYEILVGKLTDFAFNTFVPKTLSTDTAKKLING
jgi:hypothetical protein